MLGFVLLLAAVCCAPFVILAYTAYYELKRERADAEMFERTRQKAVELGLLEEEGCKK
jgi:hypothetical protein